MKSFFKENKIFKNVVIFILGIVVTLISTFVLLNALNMRVVPSSEIVSESSETQKEEQKDPETQNGSSKETEKRKKAYVIFFRVDESFLGTICDENGDILTGTALPDFDVDGPTKWSDFINFINETKKEAEKLNREPFILTEDQFEKMFPGKILC